MSKNKIALAVHGGAGTILRSEMTAALEAEYRRSLENALRIGWEILAKNGSALDAVEAATVALEDFPLFNAGKGAVFAHNGKNELDASIMNGANLAAGAVAFVQNIKNPVKLARLVMENTEHVLLAGYGANEFARKMNAEFASDDYFFTEFRYRQYLDSKDKNVVQLDHSSLKMNEPATDNGQRTTDNEAEEKSKIKDQKSKIKDQKPIGTVGAVACDFEGNLAAATSTGGMTNKKFGRIGDTPVIGAGTYANNATCAVSCTGHGEFFMKAVAAYDVAARMKYKRIGLIEAAQETIDYLSEIDGEGGLIAVDNLGNVSLPFNSEGMYRGFIQDDGEIQVDIYK